MEKTESPKITSKLVYELLATKLFFKHLNLVVEKKKRVNQRKTIHYEKLSYSPEKIQKWNIKIISELL